MAADPTWNFLDAASKGRIIETLDQQVGALFELAEDPAHWHVPTACEGWELRDMIGHLVDATEGYLTGFELARQRRRRASPVGVAGMAKASDEAARTFRATPHDELLARLRSRTDDFVRELESLSDSEWSSLLVREPYLGPLPAMVIAIGLLGGYAVHGWDVRQGLGAPHAIDADAADLLVPFVFLLWQATATQLGHESVPRSACGRPGATAATRASTSPRRASASPRETSMGAPRSSRSTRAPSC